MSGFHKITGRDRPQPLAMIRDGDGLRKIAEPHFPERLGVR